MTQAPTKAFVLAAGLGERMRPLTNNCPKPLLTVGGRTMLDRCLDALAAAGVRDVVVNTYYLPGMIEDHLQHRHDLNIIISRENELLDTGGGVKKKIDFFGDEPFYALNADVIWTDGDTPALTALANMWDAAKMDALLLLYPCADLPAHAGRGDYYLADGDDRPVFAKRDGLVPNYIFTGPRIVHPRLFDGAPDGKFSFLELFHRAEAAGRLYALRHSGKWYHVGTPDALADTDKILSAA